MDEIPAPEFAAVEEQARRGIQPDEGSALAVVLARIEPVAAAVNQAQLAKDRDTLLELQLTGFRDPEWGVVRHRLWLYAHETLPSKVMSGDIFALTRNNGIPAASDLQPPAKPVS